MFDDILDWENLLTAFRKARKGKRDRPEVAAFEWDLEAELLGLQQELATRSYRPAGYDSFYIHEPKRRLISAAPFRDRVVHHALCNRMEPVFECSFVAESFANRKGKGTHRALDQAQALARRFRHVLQMDLVQFFPSIDHGILRAEIARRVTDPAVLWLVDLILASGEGVLAEEYRMVYFPGDDLMAALRPRGLPIGNLTSQFWANVYLNPLDHFIKRELRCPGYVRYVDDLLLFGDDKRLLRDWKRATEERLARLRLTIHAGAHARPVTEGIPFLGFVVYPDCRRIKRRKVVAYRRRLGALLRDHAIGDVGSDNLLASVLGWNNHARFGNTVGLRRVTFATVPPEIRAEARRILTPRRHG
ncbi:MAG: reverse transcriptase domain-containing protein [Pseudomonadota bacterium]|nr:reverse transcriptase domain-containing protein [Pseudomonadota bacterium]